MESDIHSIIETEQQSSASVPDVNTVACDKLLAEQLREYQEARECRIATFLEFVRRRREERVASILASRRTLSS